MAQWREIPANAPPMNAPVQVTVLVVDDDPTVRELLDDYLSDNGYHVLAAGSGPEARALLTCRMAGATKAPTAPRPRSDRSLRRSVFVFGRSVMSFSLHRRFCGRPGHRIGLDCKWTLPEITCRLPDKLAQPLEKFRPASPRLNPQGE